MRIAEQLIQIFGEQVKVTEINKRTIGSWHERYEIKYKLFGQLIDVVQATRLTNFGVINELD